MLFSGHEDGCLLSRRLIRSRLRVQASEAATNANHCKEGAQKIQLELWDHPSVPSLIPVGTHRGESLLTVFEAPLDS